MIFSLSDIQFQIFVHKYHSSKIILKKFENNCVLEILDWLCITLKEKIEILNGKMLRFGAWGEGGLFSNNVKSG